MSQILIQTTRGKLVENKVRGDAVVLDAKGNIAAYVGDPELYTYMRSTAKPLQASAVIECGAADHFGFSGEELAIMCGSHSGEDYHLAVLQGILDKIGLQEADLTLGADLSFDTAQRMKQLAAHAEPRKLMNNCSGKHCCMLAICRYMGWDHRDYQRPEHPVQQLILNTVAEYSHMAVDDITVGVDGCGVPVFAMPLRNMALAYHDLILPQELSEKRRASAQRLTGAMLSYPQMVAGYGTFTTELMEKTQGRVLAKLGADAVYCAALPGEGYSVALKIEDGNLSMVAPVLLEILRQMDLLNTKEQQELAAYARFSNINCQKDKVGETRPVFHLEEN